MPYLTEITYFLILGKPLILYLGILNAILLASTATAGILVHRGKIEFKIHLTLVKITLAVISVHAILGILAYV
jgi:hypothetical protein